MVYQLFAIAAIRSCGLSRYSLFQPVEIKKAQNSSLLGNTVRNSTGITSPYFRLTTINGLQPKKLTSVKPVMYSYLTPAQDIKETDKCNVTVKRYTYFTTIKEPMSIGNY